MVATKFGYEWTAEGMKVGGNTVRFGKREGHPSVPGWRLVGAEDDTLLVGIISGDGIIPVQDVNLESVQRNRRCFTVDELINLGKAHDIIHNSAGRSIEDALALEPKRTYSYDWPIVETKALTLSKNA